MNIILKNKNEKASKEEFILIAKIIDEILNTRHKLEDICSNNFFSVNKMKKILSETSYIEDNFGKKVKEKVKEKILKNSRERIKVPRDMILVQDRYHIFIAKKDITYLDQFDFRRLCYASDYLCSGSDLNYVVNKRKISPLSVIRILSDNRLDNILKEEHLENLKRYIEIENLILSNDLNKKKEILFDFVECLYETNLNKQEVMQRFKLTENLFNKYLNELIKLPYFNNEIKEDAKFLLTIKKEKKIK